MSYEIPQELEYKEKIIFGLTFQQLIYLVIFVPIALIIFLKTNLNQALKIIICSFIIILAGGFMFFNLKQKISDFWSWYKFREFRVSSPKMRNLIPVHQIEDNTLILKKHLGGKNGKKNSNTESKTD